MLNKRGQVGVVPNSVQEPVVKKSRWWIWVIVVLVVLGLNVGSYFLFFSGGINGDRKIIRDSFYEEYSLTCDKFSENKADECRDASECIADGMVEYLTDAEAKELKIMLDKSGVKDETFSEFYMKLLDEERIALMKDRIMPCSEIIAEIMAEEIGGQINVPAPVPAQ